MVPALLFIHVLSGAIAVLAGAVTASARKGGSIHVRTGRVFVGLMSVSSILGAGLGLIRFDGFFITFFAGILGAYLVLTGWAALQPPSRTRKAATLVLGLINLANCTGLIGLGRLALSNPDGAAFGFAGEDYFFLAGMAGLAMVLDASLVVRKQISAKHRTARHLWRMLLGFFIAAGSAFTGPGASIFPEAIQQSGILSLPELAIILLLLFYLIKTLAWPRRQRGQAAS